MSFVKNFVEWFKLKPILNSKSEIPFIAEREIWWCSIGANIGTEIDGKNSLLGKKASYTRPVLIYKKLSKYSFIGIPLTSKEKFGTWFYPLKIKENDSMLIFSQVRNFDSRRLQRKIEKISNTKFSEISNEFINFLKK